MSSNKKKSQQLGMPYGTAAHKLRKNILFHYLVSVGHDDCFRCGKPIETADELSIEHKKPWMDVDPDLFWDIDNVAFSHRSCNRPDRPFDVGSLHRDKTHCPQGHEYTEDNTKITKHGYRRCKKCRNGWRSRHLTNG